MGLPVVVKTCWYECRAEKRGNNGARHKKGAKEWGNWLEEKGKCLIEWTAGKRRLGKRIGEPQL